MQDLSTANDTATAGIALRAVARHMLDHDLQVESISAPAYLLGERSIIVHVPNTDGEAYWSARWRDTLAVDDLTYEPVTHPDLPPELSSLYERFTVHGRLPDSGVRVSVVTVRRALVERVRLLQSLQGGAA